jgi:2Fe-2S ferredoxin
MPDLPPFSPDRIHLTVIYEEESHELVTYEGEYRNLMMLIFDRLYTEEFGDCRGMGRCGTCMIEILSSTHAHGRMERNEASTIGKITTIRENIRLSCQLLINSELQGIKIRVLREGR